MVIRWVCPDLVTHIVPDSDPPRGEPPNWAEAIEEFHLGSQPSLRSLMLKALFSLVFASVMWVQVPQWQPDWSQCSVDTPDVDCHWYVTAPDNTFGEGFSWDNAPWFSAEGLRDVGELNDPMLTIHNQATPEP